MTLVLCPVRDERHCLEPLLGDAAATSAEFLFVDDGSRDGSAEMLREWCGWRGRAEVLVRSQPGGKSSALVDGLLHTAGRVQRGTLDPDRVLVLADGDGQHPMGEISSLVASLQEQSADLLIAFRDLRGYPLSKQLGNMLFSWQASVLSGVLYRDSLCGLRALRCGRAGELAALLSGQGYTCEQEMCVALPRRGWRVLNNYPIRPPHRRSNPGWRDGWQIFWAGVRQCWK